MIIRTISQLHNAEISELSNGCFEISIENATNGKYTSKRIDYSKIIRDIQTTTTNEIVNTYGLSDNSGNPIDVKALKANINEIANSNFTFSGIKRFSSWPHIDKDELDTTDTQTYGDSLKWAVPNIGIVRQLVDDNIVFMSTTSSLVAEGNPMPHHQNAATDASVPESLDYSNTIGNGKFYFWHIDAGESDSSKSINDPDSGSVDGYEEIRDTGNLVMWGWLADDPDRPPAAEYCWVALYASMKCEGYNSTQVIDVPISVQPWIRGQHASTLQYVGFNVPVKKGLRLKVKTGFPVFANNSGFQQFGTMTFIDQWVPNAFFGYVIK